MLQSGLLLMIAIHVPAQVPSYQEGTLQPPSFPLDVQVTCAHLAFTAA